MTKLLNVNDLKRAARAVGATVENDSSGRWNVYQVCTRPGECWDGHLHMLKVEYQKNDPAWRQVAIQDALERIEEYGQPIECLEPECDYCHPESEAS